MIRLDRWKTATAVLALSTAVLAVRSHSDASSGEPVPAGPAVSAGGNTATLRQLRIPARALGLSEGALLDELASTRAPARLIVLCERLGFVASDRAIEALAALAVDPRTGVAEAAIAALGHIGSDAATETLVALLDGTSRRVRLAAVGALGRTGNPAARSRLQVLAASRDEARLVAVDALGQFGGDAVVEFFAGLPREELKLVTRVTNALGTIASPAALELLRELAAAPSARVRAAAIAAMPGSASEDDQETLMDTLGSGEPLAAAAAAAALGRSAATAAVPLLAEMAKSGASEVRGASIAALGQIGGDEATAALARLARVGAGMFASPITAALVNIATPEARAVLVDLARSSPDDRTYAIWALRSMGGEEVPGLLRELARAGGRDQPTALRELFELGDPEALDLAVAQVDHGSRNQRMNAIALLADADDPRARKALVQIARGGAASSRGQALEALTRNNPDDPEVTSLVLDAFRTGGTGDVQMAAMLLARMGGGDAQEALLAGVAVKDPNRARVAIDALGSMTGDPEVREALADVARNGKDDDLRSAAFNQLAASGDPAAERMASDALARGDQAVARYALYNAAQSNSPASRALLDAAAGREETSLRLVAAQALAQRGDPTAVDTLIRLSGDADESVRTTAYSGLGTLATPGAVDHLVQGARSASDDVRVSVAAALGELDDDRAGASLAALIRDRTPRVAIAALYAAARGGGGAEVEAAMRAALASPDQELARAAAWQLRSRGDVLDPATQAVVDRLTN